MIDTTGTFFLPEQVSTLASGVDALFYFIFYTSVVLFIIVNGLMVFFAIRYRRRPGNDGLTSGVAHNTTLEIIWTGIPLVLVIIAFFWGFHEYMNFQVIPKDPLEVKVTAQQWFWNFDYPDGVNIQNELVVPVHQPIRLLMSSTDVIHSFFVPTFRVKMDVLPNRYTVAWFEATRTGNFNLFCTEYCGEKHSSMIGTVRVITRDEYDVWLEANLNLGEGLTPVEFGEKLFVMKQCHTCHSNDGATNTGPTFFGIFGHEVQLADGRQITVDENYIRESILSPKAKVVAGYQPVMPTFQGIIRDQEIDALIAYIKSLQP